MICSNCKLDKEIHDFYLRYGKPRKRCKECLKNESKLTYKNNAGSVKTQKKEKYQTDPSYYIDKAKLWRLNNPDKFKTILKKYYKNNLSIFKANQHNRRARLLSNGGSFSSSDWDTLKEHYGYECLKCGKKEPDIHLTPDHVIPISKGGSNDISNIQPLCLFCNKSKHDKIADYCKEKA